MARMSLPVRKTGGTVAKAAAVSSSGAKASVAGKAVKGTLKVGKWGYKGFIWGMVISQLLDLLEYISPEKLAQLYALAEKLNIPLEDLKDTSDETTSRLILALAAQVGFTGEELASVGINVEDAVKFAKVAARYAVDQRDAHDEAQVDVVEGDDMSDKLLRMKSLSYACERLMMTGPGRVRQLYHVAMVINSIKDEHIAEFELHERTWGVIPSSDVRVL